MAERKRKYEFEFRAGKALQLRRRLAGEQDAELERKTSPEAGFSGQELVLTRELVLRLISYFKKV